MGPKRLGLNSLRSDPPFPAECLGQDRMKEEGERYGARS